MTIILTIVGGLGALWGLFLNNKKVNELVRQNDIAIQNSNDKRFGEAIGYLNSDNEGIAIGGIYALYQLAKEDSRYAPIITNIFYSYVNNNKHKEVTVQTIITLLFSENNPFISDKELIFKDLSLKNLKMYCTISKIKFVTCSFDSVDLSGECSVSFYECSMKHSLIYDFRVKWTSDIICDPHLICPAYIILRFFTGNHNDRDIIHPVLSCHSRKDLEAIHDRHHNIQQHQ